MNEKAFLEQLSPVDYTDFPGMDQKRDALIAGLKARGLVSENIIGGVKLTPAGLAYLDALKQAQEKELGKAADQRAEEEKHRREIRSERRHDWLIAVVGALIVGLVLAAVSHYLGWTS